MKKIKKVFYLFIFIIGILFSCEKSYVEVIPTKTSVSFKDDIIPIFITKCASCHQIGKTYPALILDAEESYDQLFSDGINAPYIDINNPEASILYIKMKQDMPPFGLLPNSKITLVLKWIQEGAENN